MLKSIQEMKFFLLMVFGDPKESAGSMIDVKTRGLCQGMGQLCSVRPLLVSPFSMHTSEKLSVPNSFAHCHW
jgi:hypothetical protein